MSSSANLGGEVWRALCQCPKFTELPKPLRLAYRNHVLALPDILAEVWDYAASRELVIEGRSNFLAYAASGDSSFLNDTIFAPPSISQGEYQAMWWEQYEALRREQADCIEALAPAAVLQARRANAEQALIYATLQLTPEQLDKYAQQKLSIGDIALSRPDIFVIAGVLTL